MPYAHPEYLVDTAWVAETPKSVLSNRMKMPCFMPSVTFLGQYRWIGSPLCSIH